jgi:hypothetical protein
MAKSKSVWAVEEGEYSDYHVVGIFSSESHALKMMRAINGSDPLYGRASVAEWPLNPGIAEINAGMHMYHALMLKDGSIESIRRCEYMSSYDLGGRVWLWLRESAPAYKGTGKPNVLNATVWAKSEEHAIKVVNEHRTKMIANGEWT